MVGLFRTQILIGRNTIMANVRGMTSTTSVANDPDQIIDMSRKVLMLEPGRNPLIDRLSKNKAVAGGPKFNWLTDQMRAFSDTLDAAVADGSTDTIAVSNLDRWQLHDLILAPTTGEVMRVTAVAAGTGVGNLTVARGIAGTAAAIADAAALIRLASSWGEGSVPRTAYETPIALRTDKGTDYNYTQITQTVVAQTGTVLASDYYSGDQRKYDQIAAGKDHAKAMNYTCYIGKRGISGNVRATGGFLEFVTRTAGTTSLTEANIDADLATFYRYGSARKVLFTGRRVSAKISQNAHDRVQVGVTAPTGDIDKGSTYGGRVRTYVGDSGEFDIVVDDFFTDNSTYAGYGLHLDMSDTAYRFLAGRDTKLHTDVELPGQDGKVDLYRTEWGIQRGHASHHGMWTAVAA